MFPSLAYNFNDQTTEIGVKTIWYVYANNLFSILLILRCSRMNEVSNQWNTTTQVMFDEIIIAPLLSITQSLRHYAETDVPDEP